MRILNCRNTPTARYAAEELAKYVRLMTDCRICPEIAEAEACPPLPCADTVVLGLLEQLGRDASDLKDPFVDDIIDGEIENCAGFIAGSNDRSILMGVYRYCTSAGCCFARPGENGEYVPHCELETHAWRERHKADYPFRGECCEGAISYEHMRDTVYWLPKAGMNMYMIEGLVPYTYMHKWYGHVGNRCLRQAGQVTDYDMLEEYIDKLEQDIVKTGIQLHNVGHGWMFEKLGVHHASGAEERRALREEDKQYLAQVNGVRDICHGSTFYTHFCYSNPAARRILVDFCVEYIRNKPWIDFLHLWLADATNNNCECENCVRMLPSDHYVQLLNEIDAALEGIESKTRLVFILYNDTVRPPEKLRLKHPERFVILAAIGNHYEKGYRNVPFEGEIPPYVRNRYEAPSNPLRLKWHRDWKALCGNIPSIIYEYRYYTDMYCDPGYMRVSRETHRDMKLLDSVAFQGCMSDQTHRMYMPTALPLIMMGQTLWDTSSDFDAVCDAYFSGAFGADGAQVRTYLETLSDLFCPGNLRSTVKTNIEDEGLETKDGDPVSWIGNPAVAEKAARIPAVVDAFLPVIEHGMLDADACRRLSWTYLRIHARLCRELSAVVEAGAKGDMDAARAAYDALELWLSRIEPEYHNVFDLFLFERFWRPKLGLPSYPYYD